MPEKIAFFDIDHTLIRRSSGVCFLLEAVRQGVVSPSLLLVIPRLYFKYVYRNVRWDEWAEPLPGIEGIPLDAVTGIANAAFDRSSRKVLIPAMRERISDLKRGGIPVWLASSSVDIIVSPLAEYLGSDGLIASSLETRDGICTGFFCGKPAFGPEKLRRVRELADSLGVGLDECSFYSDSIHDLPLLDAVGMPVAVNPDFRLARVARRRGWELVRC